MPNDALPVWQEFLMITKEMAAISKDLEMMVSLQFQLYKSHLNDWNLAITGWRVTE